MAPKIIQIAVSGTEDAHTIYVLHDDGTLWFSVLQDNTVNHWQRIPSPAESEAILAATQD